MNPLRAPISIIIQPLRGYSSIKEYCRATLYSTLSPCNMSSGTASLHQLSFSEKTIGIEIGIVYGFCLNIPGLNFEEVTSLNASSSHP